jgi:hypothetical protein
MEAVASLIMSLVTGAAEQNNVVPLTNRGLIS